MSTKEKTEPDQEDRSQSASAETDQPIEPQEEKGTTRGMAPPPPPPNVSDAND